MADKNLEEYKQLAFYKKNTKARQNGFAKFKDDEAHYFALYKGGDIVMLSQAYVNEAGRDNGIESVRKNSKLKKRYVYDTRKGGKHGFGLKAGNGQEIAISPNYTSKSAAETAAGRLNGSIKTAAKKTSAVKAAPKKKTPAKKKAVPAKAKVVASKTDGRVENYHPLAFYKKHGNGVADGFDSFSEGGAHYFTYNEAGKIALISESYTSKAGRDNGIASVKKNMPVAKRYQHHTHKNGKHYFDLNAGNGQEIATSVWYGSAAAATAGAAYLAGTRKRAASPKAKVRPKTKRKARSKAAPIAGAAALAATAAAAPKVRAKVKPKAKPKPKAKTKRKAAPIVATAALATAAAAPAMAKAAKPVTPRDKDDDYLKCEAYHGHKVTDAKNNVALFSHSNNKEYFVVYDDDGDVLIRSEGFDSISKRSSELAAVLRLKDNPKYFTRIEKNGYVMNVLNDENGREVGRSCLHKIVPPAAVVAAPIAAAAAVPAAAATGGMSWGWLKWLLPLLLLLLLGFLGLKGCSAGQASKAKVEAAAVQAKKVAADKAMAAKKLAAEKAATAKKMAADKAAAAKAAAATAAAATAEKAAAVVTLPPAPKPAAPKPVTPKVVTANMNRLCSTSETVLFNVPTYATPVNVGRLGTFPEFGDSHGLTPTQFHSKLANRYASSNFDRQYLNYMAKSLGYVNGFSDMSAADFSNETLAKGTKGLLGYGEFHGLAYSQLNVKSPRDLEAFRVRAANGTDVHFMKTCGNYMYVCN